MKNTIIVFVSLLAGCVTTSRIDWSNSYWGELESPEAYLYTADSLTAIVEKEIKQGSILFFHTKCGDFQEVYTMDPQKIDKETRNSVKYFLYKPKYKRLPNKYTKIFALLYEIPFDPNQTYITGERGGCYYINRNGNKTYVNRSYCGVSEMNTISPSNARPSTFQQRPSSDCSSVQCSGTTQKGTRCRNRTTNCSGRCHLH